MTTQLSERIHQLLVVAREMGTVAVTELELIGLHTMARALEAENKPPQAEEEQEDTQPKNTQEALEDVMTAMPEPEFAALLRRLATGKR